MRPPIASTATMSTTPAGTPAMVCGMPPLIAADSPGYAHLSLLLEPIKLDVVFRAFIRETVVRVCRRVATERAKRIRKPETRGGLNLSCRSRHVILAEWRSTPRRCAC